MNEMESGNNRAYVPEFLQKHTVKTMPIDTPYFIWSEDGFDDENSPSIWVNSRMQLCVSAATEIPAEDDMPYWDELPGRFGLMRAAVQVGADRLHEGYVADLRFIEPHSLEVNSYDATVPADPEEFADWTEWNHRMIEVDGFLYEDEDEKICYSGAPLYENAARYMMKIADSRPDSPRSNKKLPETHAPTLVDSAKTSLQSLRTRIASRKR